MRNRLANLRMNPAAFTVCGILAPLVMHRPLGGQQAITRRSKRFCCVT